MFTTIVYQRHYEHGNNLTQTFSQNHSKKRDCDLGQEAAGKSEPNRAGLRIEYNNLTMSVQIYCEPQNPYGTREQIGRYMNEGELKFICRLHEQTPTMA